MGINNWKFLHHSIRIFINFRVQEEEPAKPAEPAEEGGEQQQQQQPKAEQQAENNQNQGDEDESGMWEETFKTHTDSKPNGKFSLI